MVSMIYNPIAGGGNGEKVGQMVGKLLSEREIEYVMEPTARPGHATELAKAASLAGAQMVIAIGGDGTAHEVAQGLLGTQTPLAIIPAGTGNDFVKTIAMPVNPKEALEYILSHPAKATDVGLVNDRMFLNEIGTGFDVMVLDYTEKAKKYVHGFLPYLYGVLQTMYRFRSIDLAYTLEDGQEISRKAFVMAAANGGYIGGGIRIAPEARVDDGLLDVVVVGDVKKRHLPRRLAGLLRGKILTFPETEFHRVKCLSFSAPKMRLNIDGEVITTQRADVRILPGALQIHR